MSRHQRFLDRAIGVALTSDCRFKHGAVITKGSRVLAWSPNIFRNDSRIDYEGATFHAEDAAVRELYRSTGETYGGGMGSLKGYTMYIARVNRQGEPRLSRPCSACFDLLLFLGITDFVYTSNHGTLSHERVE